MNNLKEQVAEIVQGAIERELATRIQQIGGVESVEALKVSPLATQLRVKLDVGGGPRYFLVRVSEQI